jgi:MFS family permease
VFANHRSARLSFAFRALTYPNYRLLMGGQIVSLLGTWMAATTTSWLAYRISGSPLVLGAVAFATQVPMLVLAPIAGHVVDSVDRRRLLIATQASLMAVTITLGMLTRSGSVSVAWLIALSLVQGNLNAIDLPCRSVLALSVIERREDLANAIAINGIVVNASRMTGAALAGALIVNFGEAWCYLIDGASYLAPIAALLMMRLDGTIARPQRARERFWDGWQRAVSSGPTRSIVLLLLLMTFWGIAYSVLMPVVVADVFHGGAQLLGWLLGASAAGALVASLVVATLRSMSPAPTVIAGAASAYGLGMIAFSMCRDPRVALVITAASGAASMLQLALSNTVLQTIVPEQFRGRVMSGFFLATVGIAPFGSLLAGAMTPHVGAPAMLATAGVCCIGAACWFATEAGGVHRSLQRAMDGSAGAHTTANVALSSR